MATNQSMFEVMEALNERMAQFEKDLQKTPPTSSTENISADFKAFKTFTVQVVRAFQVQLNGLLRDVDRIEMRSRRKVLLLHGVQEVAREDSADVVTKVIVKNLNIGEFNTGCINRCQRMGQATQNRPRPLLIKFKDISMRDKVWYSKTSFKGTGITLSEFLTKSRHEAFMAARQRFGLNKSWTQNGNIIVIGRDGTRHRVSTLEEVHNIAPTETTKPVQPSTARAGVKEPVPHKSRRAASSAARK